MLCGVALAAADPGSGRGRDVLYSIVVGVLLAALIETACVARRGDVAWALVAPFLVSAGVSGVTCVTYAAAPAARRRVRAPQTQSLATCPPGLLPP